MQRRSLFLILAALAATATGCDQQPSSSSGGPVEPTASLASRPLATLVWNQTVTDLIVKTLSSPPFGFRAYALVGVAQYNAIVAAGGGRARAAGAAGGASVAVLTYLYPSEAGNLEQQLIDQQATWGSEGGKSFAAGADVGRTVAAGIVARAQTDRFNDVWTGTVPICPGCWVATTPPLYPLLGSALPFFLESGKQFRPGPPPAFGSEAYLAALAEVRHISDTRTAQQDSIAKFWAVHNFNGVAVDLLIQHPRSERLAAHILALTDMAAYDALIASHDAKYTYWMIRPIQADPLITLSIPMPSHPSYTSNHATASTASALVLGAFFPDQRASLSALAHQAALSRIWGGIHYRFDMDAGEVLGRRVGQVALNHDVQDGKPFVLK
jgi:hypothetical protein